MMSAATGSTSFYFNNKALSRREFFQWLLAISGALATLPPKAHAASGPVFGWLDLHNGHFSQSPSHIATPHGCPGSLMKLVSAALLLETHRLSPEEHLAECRGQITRHGKIYRCQVAHGSLHLTQALAHSCNVYFAQAADRVSSRELLGAAQAWGLLQSMPTGTLVEAQRYCLGLSPDLQPTLRQILNLSAHIAKQGQGPEPSHLSLSLPTWKLLSSGMRLAAKEGTARALDPEDTFHLAVKTGTTPHGYTFQSWITGYFPYEAPRYTFCLRAPSGTSLDTAVPLARQALRSRSWP